MKTIATLISKEKLPRNYKLTFKNDRGILYLVLHEKQKFIYYHLRKGINYNFFYFKGKKNYYFIKAQTIKEVIYDDYIPISKMNVKTMFIKKQLKSLKLKELTQQNIYEKQESINKLLWKPWKLQNNPQQLELIFDMIKTYYLKHEELKVIEDSKQNQKEKEFLQNLKNLILFNRLKDHY